MAADKKTDTSNDYWPGLSALRAIAMLLGITLHAAVPYLTRPMNGLAWVVQETPSVICDVAFWWVHAWRLPLFFFLAGFFAKLISDRHGPMGFARHRFRRLVVPYVVACYTIGPIIYAVFAGGWYLTGQCTWEQMLPHIPFRPELQSNIFGPAHLWFLQDLIILSVVYLYLSIAVGSTESTTREVPNLGPVRWWIPLAAAVPCGLLLWSDLSPLLDFNNTFLADPPRLLYYGTFFIGGLAAYRNRTWFLQATKFYKVHLWLSVPFGVLFMWVLHTEMFDIQSLFGRLAVGLVSTTVAWLAIYGLIGWFVHRVQTEHPAIQYIADSSYWMYLCHLPIVAALHVGIHDIELPSTIKFLIVSAVTTVVGLCSYQLFVRYTVIGNFLHGPKTRPGLSAQNEFAASAPVVIAMTEE